MPASPSIPVTAVIAARNEAKHITACIDSVRWAAEIIVAEHGSIDSTAHIAHEAGTIVSVDDDELGGPVQMQNVLFRLSESPGSIRWAGGPHGANTDEVLAEIGVTPDQLAALRAAGVV